MGGGKMKKPELPQWAQESVICWYSPRYQGATNASLAEDPRLIDLSGKGNDLTLTGFEFLTDKPIEKGGMFFNRGQYAISKNIAVMNDFTAFVRCDSLIANSLWPCFFGKGNAFRFPHWWGGWCAKSYNGATVIENYDQTKPLWMTPTLCNGQTITRGTRADTEAPIGINYYDDYSRTGQMMGRLYSAILFDRTLTEEERDYILKNIIN